MKIKRTLVSCFLALVILGCLSGKADAALNENLGAIMQNLSFATIQNGSNVFYRAGVVILVIALVSKLKNAADLKDAAFSIFSTLALAWAMSWCISGSGGSPTGWCFFASNISNSMAYQLNSACFTTGAGGHYVYDPTGLYKQNWDLIVGGLTGQMTTDQTANMTATGSSGSNVPTGQGWGIASAIGSLVGAITDIGKMLTALIMAIIYPIIAFICEILALIALYISSVIIDLATVLQQFLLYLSSVFLPLFIAALSLPSLRGQGMTYIMSCVSIASWPMGWAAGHIGTLALEQMVVQSAADIYNHIGNITVVLQATLLTLVLPFWIIVVTLCAPYVMGKMLTTGANFASSIAKTSLQVTAVAVGSAALAAAAVATAGAAAAAGGAAAAGAGGAGAAGAGGAAAAGAGGAGAAGAGGAAAAGAGGAGAAGAGGAATTAGGAATTAGGAGSNLSSLSNLISKAGTSPKMADGSTMKSILNGLADVGEVTGNFLMKASKFDGSGESLVAAIKEPNKSSAKAMKDAGMDPKKLAKPKPDSGAKEESGPKQLELFPETAKEEEKGKSDDEKKPSVLRKIAAAGAGPMKSLGKLLVKASKFDGSGESLVSSGLLEIPTPQKKQQQTESQDKALMTDIRDTLKSQNSSLKAMRDSGIDPKNLAKPNTPDPIPAAKPETQNDSKPGIMMGQLKSFGKLLNKASSFDGSGDSLVRSGLLEVPAKNPVGGKGGASKDSPKGDSDLIGQINTLKNENSAILKELLSSKSKNSSMEALKDVFQSDKK